MFTGAGANYYASAFYGGDIIDEFLNGAKNFTDANNKIISIEKLTTPYYYTDNNVWRSADGSVAFMGNWAGTLASPNSTTDYDESAAAAWYNSKAPTASLSYNPGSGIKTGTMVTFTGTASDPDNDPNLSYAWNFGDGATATGLTATHSYVCNGTYKVRFKATDSYGKAYTSSKSITVGTPPKPDLVVYSIAKSGTNIYVKVKNQGCASISRFVCPIYGMVKYSDKSTKTVMSSSLNPGAYKVVKITRFKYYHGKAKVDYYNKVSEKSETNNVKSF